MSFKQAQVQSEKRFYQELIDGLVHEFPLCCVLAYCADIYFGDSREQATQRGIVLFRSFSIVRDRNIFGPSDRIESPDHFVPCTSCAVRLKRKLKNLSMFG